MTGQPIDNSHVKYQYTISPSDIENGLQADWWKGEGPPKTLPILLGFQNVGVRAAYTKALYYYDTLVKKWLESFETLTADEREVIPVKNILFGTPERVFAIDKEKGIGSMTQRVVLPAINFVRKDITKVYDRGPTQRTARRRIDPTEDKFLNYAEIKSTYHLVDLPYQIDFWTKYQSEMQMLQEQILLPFMPNGYFRLIMPEYYFDEIIMVRLGGIVDTSALEPEGERLIRCTANITLQAYIPVNVSKIVRTMKSVVLEPMDVTQQFRIYTQEQPSDEWNIALRTEGGEPRIVVFDDQNNHIVEVVLEWNVADNGEPAVRVRFLDNVPRVGTAYVFGG